MSVCLCLCVSLSVCLSVSLALDFAWFSTVSRAWSELSWDEPVCLSRWQCWIAVTILWMRSMGRLAYHDRPYHTDCSLAAPPPPPPPPRSTWNRHKVRGAVVNNVNGAEQNHVSLLTTYLYIRRVCKLCITFTDHRDPSPYRDGVVVESWEPFMDLIIQSSLCLVAWPTCRHIVIGSKSLNSFQPSLRPIDLLHTDM